MALILELSLSALALSVKYRVRTPRAEDAAKGVNSVFSEDNLAHPEGIPWFIPSSNLDHSIQPVGTYIEVVYYTVHQERR